MTTPIQDSRDGSSPPSWLFFSIYKTTISALTAVNVVFAHPRTSSTTRNEIKMPSAGSFFSWNRETGCWPHSSATTTSQQQQEQLVPQPRNKLKKRPVFHYSERNVVSYDLSKLVSNKHTVPLPVPDPPRYSVPDIPRPLRPPHLSQAEPPALPDLPIYETFTVETPPVVFPEQVPQISGVPPPVPAPDEVLADWTRRHNNTQRQSPSTSHVISSGTVAKRPQYDRASRLAESYRSLLPDIESMDYSEACSAIEKRLSGQGLSIPQESPRESHHTTTHHDRGSPVPSTAEYPPQPPRRNSMRTTSMTESSITAVGSEGTAQTDTLSVTDSTPAAPRRSSRESARERRQASRRRMSNASDTSLLGTAAAKPRSSNYIGLQICSELLTDELLKIFLQKNIGDGNGNGHRNSGRGPKLQILLLIEAYEAMLDTCRKEARKAAVLDCERRKHMRDTIRIVDQWLSSLYVVYDEALSQEATTLTGGPAVESECPRL